MQNLVERIFDKIALLQTKAGCTDREIAIGIGLSPSGYSRMKKRRSQITINYLAKIADFFHVPLYFLLYTEDELKRIEISFKVRAFVAEKTWSADYLAIQVGVSEQRIEEILQGHIPTPIEFALIAVFLRANYMSETVDIRMNCPKYCYRRF